MVIDRDAPGSVRSRAVVVDGYVRWSAGGCWGATPASIDRSHITTWAESRGWQIGCVFEEPAPAGSAAGGSRLRAALERVESGESDGLIVARLKHLGSSLGEAVAVLERIQAAGGTFVSVRDELELGSPSGRLILRLLVSVLEW